ncbi:MAG: ABC transporter substrate-binding protein [Cocleimonas sp.]|nr:ABC transporter substrate-binding protein [Cocleimonas sp.]
MNVFNLNKVVSLTVLVASLFSASTAMAKSNDAADAQEIIMHVTTSVVNELGKNKARYQSDPKFLDSMIRRDMLPVIDFNGMAKLTLGKHWRKASASQRQRFTSAYREMLIRSYGKIMLKYAGASIRSGNSVAGKRAGYVKVRTVVTPRGGTPVAANYDVRKLSGKWKAYNVQVGGVNLITNFRTNFTREVSAKGIEALIARLNKTKK